MNGLISSSVARSVNRSSSASSSNAARSSRAVAGRAASAYIAGTPESDLPLPLSAPKAVGGRRFVSALFRNAIIPLANRFGV